MRSEDEAQEKIYRPLGAPKPMGVDLAGCVGTGSVSSGVGTGSVSSGVGRQSARSLIQSRIQKLRREADGLESLLRSIPEHLPQEADEALWSAMLGGR